MPVENARPLAGHQINNTPMRTLQGLPKASWLLLALTCKCVSLRSRNEIATRRAAEKPKRTGASPVGGKATPGRSDLRSARAAQGWGRWSSCQPRKAYAALRPQALEPDQSGATSVLGQY